MPCGWGRTARNFGGTCPAHGGGISIVQTVAGDGTAGGGLNMENAMYYESYERKKPRRRKRRRGGCLGALLRFFGKLIALALVLAVLAAVGLYFLPVSLFMVEPDYDLALSAELPSSPINVLVLGVDVLNDGSQRSDTMMIASIDRGVFRLTSIQRDTYVEIDGHGRNKINAAYAFGGPELAMRTVNQAFGLNIMHYIVVDFTALVDMVDALGGIELDITEAEREQININVVDSAKVFYRLGYSASELLQSGENTHLDGLQALGYARIRSLDSDFVRTSRQRAVVEAMLQKLRERLWNPVVVGRFIAEGLEGIRTNLNLAELAALGEKALFAGGMEQLRVPVNGTFDDDGSKLTITDAGANRQALYRFIYAE